MKNNKRIDVLLYSNIFISICACAITIETYLLIHSEINWLYAGFIFSSSLVLYNYPSLFLSGNEQHSERQRWILANKKIIQLIFISALIATGVLIFLIPLKLILWFAPVAVLSFAYFLPITNLRAIPILKALVVALVWTCITYYFPMLLSFDSFPNGEEWSGALRFFFFLPLAIAFNIRDVKVDRTAGIKTLPVMFGIQKTKIVCIFFLVVCCVLTIFTHYDGEIKSGLLLSSSSAAVLILFASENRSEYFYSLWLDGMIILQAGLVLFCF